ncbi:MAG: helix-turn-helix domain-containing protein [Eggerthellaceae bacterium]|nr:helix-turn-helix domain-containing protein [Eggerthellaceae bacterium]
MRYESTLTNPELIAARSAVRARAENRRLGGRAGEIMQAARVLFERDGVGATTVTRIAQECGMTRELFYYYFPSKQGVVDAVLDDYIEDIVESVAVWNEMRAFGATPESLRACIATLRRTLYDADGSPRPMIRVVEELRVRDAFDVRGVRAAAEYLCNNVVSEYDAYHEIAIDYVFEMFCLVLFGLVGLMKVNPGITDDALMKVVEQTLRLDMTPLPAEAQRSGEARRS